jgi:N-acetylglucosaminyldiphosphoundecaprenol N-acetyl-beta-D-mannosaminyltransferase
VQRAGLEWAQRLINDPRRLAKRYLLDDPAFIKLIFLEWRARRQRQPGAGR